MPMAVNHIDGGVHSFCCIFPIGFILGMHAYGQTIAEQCIFHNNIVLALPTARFLDALLIVA
jgi:hypothetical protein